MTESNKVIIKTRLLGIEAGKTSSSDFMPRAQFANGARGGGLDLYLQEAEALVGMLFKKVRITIELDE